MAEKYSRKQVKILIRGGNPNEWKGITAPLLEGEFGYEYNAKDTKNLTILKIGNGKTAWESLGLDKNGNYNNDVFFSGRGAGILPAIMDDSLAAPLGGIKLHSKTENKKKNGLVIDEDGFLSLWNDKGYYSLVLDELKVGKLIADFEEIQNFTQSNFIKIRQKVENGIDVPQPALKPEEYAGIEVMYYDGSNSTKIVTNNLGEWGVLTTSEYIKNFTPLVLLDEKAPEGPVLLNKTDTGNGIESKLIKWEPNSFTVEINHKDTNTYLPYGEGASYINIPTLTEIKVLTREFAEGEKPSPEETYKIDAEGKITIELPLITGYSIDKWDKKVDDIQLNGTSLIPENSESKIGNILVDASTLENNIITAPIQKISYDGKELPIQAHKVSILPEKYDVIESETFKDDSETFINIGKTYDSSNLTHTYSVGIKHALHAIDIANTPIYQFGKDFTAIEVHRYSFNKYGHAEGNTIIHYSFTDLLERIDKLENRIKALESAK